MCVKLNPVNDYVGPLLEAALQPLVAAGAVQVAYGGAGVGGQLTAHALVDSVHITGSIATAQAVLRGGPGAEGGAPGFSKGFTAELGCVTPCIVVPSAAAWSRGELAQRAGEIAHGLANNASCNCVATKVRRRGLRVGLTAARSSRAGGALNPRRTRPEPALTPPLNPQVLVTSAAWPQRGAFLDALRAALAAAAPRALTYPGSAAKLKDFLAAYPKAEALCCAPPAQGAAPFYFVGGLRPDADEYAFVTETWAPTLVEAGNPPSRQRANPAGEGRTSPRPAPGLRVRRPRCQVALPEEKPDEFMAAAASFCNDRLFGTLSATLYVHPREGRTHGQALQARPLFPWQPRRRPEQRVLRLGSRLDSDGL